MSINSFLAIWKWKNSHKSRKKLSINSLKFLIHPFEHLIWDGSFECPQHMFYLRIKKIMSNYTLLSVKCLFMHAWIQEVLSAGGIQAWRPENSLNNAFFLSPQLILQFTEGVKWFYYRETILFQGSRGGPTFTRGGVQLFPRGGGGGGVQMLISIETHITCDFPEGVHTPYLPPLDLHMLWVTSIQ